MIIYVSFFFFRKTTKFKWKGVEKSPFFIETNISGEYILKLFMHTNLEKRKHNKFLILKKSLILLMLQDDKDLVHEFVQNDGLSCLIKVGSEADQNYQNYILRGKIFLLGW